MYVRQTPWQWRGEADANLTRRVAMITAAVVTAVVLGWVLLGVWAVSQDWDGTPYKVHNGCGRAVYVDNGRDGLAIAPDETITVSGFNDLELQIGVPGELTFPIRETFTVSPVDLTGTLCPDA